MTRPSEDYALIQRALMHWQVTGRSRDALARTAGIDRVTFHRWCKNPQCVIREPQQRRWLELIASPSTARHAALAQLLELQQKAKPIVRERGSALQLWQAIRANVAELLALFTQTEL